MEISREYVINMLKQVDFDPTAYDFLRSRASDVRSVLLEVAKGEAEEADDYMRKNAIAMLGTAGDETCVDALVELLSHERTEFRANAIRSLGKIGTAKAATGLKSKLSKAELPATEGKIIVAALAQIGEADSADAIKGFRKRFAAEKKESPSLERDLQEMDNTISKLQAKSQ